MGGICVIFLLFYLHIIYIIYIFVVRLQRQLKTGLTTFSGYHPVNQILKIVQI